MRRTILLFCCTLVVLFSSCKKKEIPEEDHHHYFIIKSILSPKQPFTMVSVLLIDLVEGTGSYTTVEPSENSKVTISVNSKSYALSYDQQLYSFVIDSSQLKIVAGATYTLNVTAGDGTRAIAQTIIPEQINPFINTYTKDTTKFGYVLNSSWKDAPETNNFYQLSINYTDHNTMQSTSKLLEFMDLKNSGAVIAENMQFECDSTKNETVNVSLSSYSQAYNDFMLKNDHRSLISTNVSNGFGYFSGKNTTQVKLFP